LVVAIFEGLGITMLLPLLKSTEMGAGGEFEGKGKIFVDALAYINIPFTFQSILLLIGLLFLAKGLVKFGHSIYQGFITASLNRQLKNRMIQSYANMNYLQYAANNTGHYTNILGGQIGQFIASFRQLSKFSAEVITTSVYLIIALFLSWQFSLMAIGAGAVVLFFLRYLSNYSKGISIQVSKENRRLQKFMIQTLHAMKYLKSTARFEKFLKDIRSSIRRIASMQYKLNVAGGFVEAVKEPLTVFLIIGIILLQVLLFGQEVAPIIVTLLLFYRSMNTMIMAQHSWQMLMNRIGGLEMVSEEFQDVKGKQEEYGSSEIKELQTGLELKNVSFAYSNNNDVLKNIDLTIPKNKTVAIVGESGAGKSTLIDLLTCLIRPQKGELYLDNVPSEELYYPAWRKKIGFVPQETTVFDDTAANNISLWSCDQHDPTCQEQIQEAAHKAYCHHFIQKLPKGYQTRIGDKGVRLSGGQRQRLSIARELFKEPELLILDEATSSLDTESERFIQRSIDELKGKMTVVIIAHRLSTIRNADYIYVLDEGRLVESGSYSELSTKDGSKFKKMVELQSL